MLYREFGDTGIWTSLLCYGSMRLDPQRFTRKEAVRLLAHLYDLGVTTFHSSFEYAFHEFFCECLRGLMRDKPAAELAHICKIPVPHFDETEFCAQKFRDLIERQLLELGVERMAIAQWLMRQTNMTDSARLANLRRFSDDIQDICERLCQEGKIGCMASFPYSLQFGEVALSLGACKGLVTYLNPLELDYLPLLDGLNAHNQGFVAIRPLFAGLISPSQQSEDDEQTQKVLLEKRFAQIGIDGDEVLSFALQFPLLHPSASSVMVSVNTIAHVDEAVQALDGVYPDKHRFEDICQSFLSQS